MKYLFGLIAITSVLLTSCNEEVDLTGDFKETVVVHGVLDQSDSIHYIKINRAFIGPGNALEFAQIPDSSYFTDLVATVTELVNGSQTRQWILRDTLVDNKDTNGVFFAPTQKLYYFQTITTADLNPNATYKLNINVSNGKYIVNGTTELVSGITSPISSQNFSFKFSDNPGSYINQGVTASNSGNSHILAAKLFINYYEYIGADSTLKTVPWSLGEAEVEENEAKTFTAVGQTFYNLVKASVTNNPSITKRRFENLTLQLTGGAEELANYISVNEPSSTLAQSKPTYTNLEISGTSEGRVLGIFSARQTLTYVRKFYLGPGLAFIRSLDKKSTRELSIGPITGTYLFCSDHVADNTETWYCN
ncbi:MAG: hypothetical protein V4638_07410 [Bacteroidota bacterium]